MCLKNRRKPSKNVELTKQIKAEPNTLSVERDPIARYVALSRATWFRFSTVALTAQFAFAA